MKEVFIVHPKFQSVKNRLKAVLASFSQSGEYVTKGERNVIKKFEIDGFVFNIKKFKKPNSAQKFVYQFLRKSKAKRSFEYATKLIDLEIKTPFPVAYLENFSTGLQDSYYISKHLDYDFDFRVLIHQPKFKNRNEILKQFTAFTFKLHENNINFLDHSPGNTLIKDNLDGTYSFYLIDLNRMRFEKMDFQKRMHNFRRLWPSKAMIKIIAEEYSKMYNKSFDETHRLLLSEVRKFQKVKNAKKIRKQKWRRKKSI